jgi:hypothetical protein
MPFTGWLGPFTGEGKVSINGGADVVPIGLDFSVDSISTPYIRVIGSVIPRRLQYAGSFGFSYPESDHNGTTRDFMVYERVIDMEYIDLTIPDFIVTGGNAAKDLWYRFRPGLSAYIGCWY